MLYIIVFTFTFTSMLYISSSLKPNISNKNKCVNCEFFLNKKNSPFVLGIENTPEYGKCSLFKKEKRKYKKNIDENEETNNIDFYHCTTARGLKEMCGEEGRFYRHKKVLKRSRCVNKLRKLINYYLGEYEEEDL